jgi:hypothetical protein
MNIPKESLRWTLANAAQEFGYSKTQLINRLNKQNIQPDENGLFSTQQIMAALTDKSKLLKDEYTKEQIEKLKLHNAAVNAEFLRREDIDCCVAFISERFSKIVQDSILPAKDKKDIIANINDIPKQLDEIARKQGSWIKQVKDEEQE